MVVSTATTTSLSSSITSAGKTHVSLPRLRTAALLGPGIIEGDLRPAFERVGIAMMTC
jgi:hypothetical protein